MNTAIGQGYNTAFNNAQQQMNTGAQLGLQGAQAGIQGAGQLGQLGTQQLAAQQGILGTQNQMGAQEQQNQQNVINQALQNYGNQQNYGTTQATNIMNLLRSTPTTQTQTQYQAPPSALSQIAGLGTTAYAASKLAGGGIAKVKKFDIGGSVENQLYKMPTDALGEEVKTTPSQTIKNTGNAILEERKLGTTPTPAYAPGGIVAFAEGGESDITPVELPEEEDMTGNPMGEFSMPSYIMAASKAPQQEKKAEHLSVPKGAKDFYNFMQNNIREVAHKMGVKNPDAIAHLGAAQSAIETGYGKHAPDNNFFGIKGAGQKQVTQEYVPGKGMVAVTDSFRGYATPEESIKDYIKFLSTNPRYENVLAAETPMEAIQAQHKTGYATDPKYGQKLTSVYQQNVQGKAEGGIAHFAKGGKTPDYTDDVPYAPEAASQTAKEPYPGYERDKAMYQGIGSYLSNIPRKLSPLGIVDDLKSIKDWGQTPVEEQAKQFRSASSRNAQAASPDKFVAPPVNIPTVSSPIAPSAKTGISDADYAKYKAMNDTSGERRFAQSQVKPSVAPTSQPTTTPDYTNDVPYSSDAASQPLSSAAEEQPPVSKNGGISTRDTIQQMLMDRMAKQGENAQQDKWMSLLSAGLGMMGGSSPYALQNIAAGGQQGIAAQMAAKRNQLSEQNATLTGLLGLERAHATNAYHQAQLAQNYELRKDQLNEVIRSHTATEEEKKNALAELTRMHNLQDQNADETRQQNKLKFNMGLLDKRKENAQRQAIAELKLNPMALMGKSAEDINMMVTPRVHQLLNNPSYRKLHKETWGDDPYETAEASSNSGNVLKFDSKGNQVK
jgi:flagellum-specific peptidoglycan hydrolase FlgJ